MKKIFYALIVLMMSCSEDYIGQYPVDKVSPGKVKNPTITNFAGKSEITYELPSDEDLLYVKALYTLPNGAQAEERASFYQRQVLIKGFGKSQKHIVKLMAVDRSENESVPLEVEIEPEDSPIYAILSSITVFSSWGGLKVLWENPDAENIVVELIGKTNSVTEFSSLDNFYTAEKNANKSVRGMDTLKVTVGVFVRDRYSNYTDTVYNNYKPLFEQQLDRTKFKGLPQSPNYTLHPTFGNKSMSVLWDNIISPGDNVYYIVPGGPPNPYFTMDLGVTAKLSRFKFWSRDQWWFQLHSPKHFEIWGTNDPTATTVDNWNGWYKIMDQEAYRPSGLPAGATPTTDDIAYAIAGEEYEFDISNPTVRYIRFRCTETWSGSTGLNLSEIRFWGAVQ